MMFDWILLRLDIVSSLALRHDSGLGSVEQSEEGGGLHYHHHLPDLHLYHHLQDQHQLLEHLHHLREVFVFTVSLIIHLQIIIALWYQCHLQCIHLT